MAAVVAPVDLESTMPEPADPMDVTVVIPNYNASSTIAASLASIQAQTKSPQKVLLVDDRSTDDSIEVARATGTANFEVVVLPENSGPGAARNVGASRATTEWLAFLDADDTWEPTFLEEVCDAIIRYSADYGSSGGVRQNRRKGAATMPRLMDAPPEAMDLTRSFWRVALDFMPIHSSAVVVRRSLFDAAGGYQENIRNGEDVSLWLRLWLLGRFAFVNRSLFRSVAPATGLSASRVPYGDVRKAIRPMAGSVGRAIRTRKAGTGWLIIWFMRAVVQRHRAWLRRR